MRSAPHRTPADHEARQKADLVANPLHVFDEHLLGSSVIQFYGTAIGVPDYLLSNLKGTFICKQVYDLSTRSRQQPLFTFSTTGGSNAEPGIITSVGPLAPTTVPAVLISVAGKGAHGVSEDAKRTARVIAAYVSEQLAARGYLPAGKKAGKAKRPGEL